MKNLLFVFFLSVCILGCIDRTQGFSGYPHRVGQSKSQLPGQPQAMTVYNNRLWVTINADSGNGKVCEIDPNTLAVLHTVSVGDSPQSIHGAFGYLWTGNFTDFGISRINLSTYSSTKMTSTMYANQNAITDDGTYIYLAAQEWATQNDIVAKIDPATLTEISHVYLGGANGDPYGICYANGQIFVGRFNNNDILVVNPSTMTVTQDVLLNTPMLPYAPVGSNYVFQPGDITLFNGKLYSASWGGGAIIIMNPSTYAVTGIPLNFYSSGYSWVVYGCTSGSNYIWVNDYEAGRLHKIDPTYGDIGWADSSMSPQGIAYLNGFIYTADSFNHVIVKIADGNNGVPHTLQPKGYNKWHNWGTWGNW